MLRFFALAIFIACFSVLARAGAPKLPYDEAKNDAGYIQTKTNRHLFYWYFESRTAPESAPVVLWMSGGPGCSGQVAMLGENGPFTVGEDLQPKKNENSWTNNATVIWIDQPAGAGFSYGSYITNEDQQAADTYDFLEQFFAKYPQYKSNDFFIIGESYAGHYVPAISAKLVKEIEAGNSKINYKGSAIGNGLTDPQVQFKNYAPYLEMYNHYGPNGQAVKPSAITLMKAANPACEALIAGCNANVSNTTKYLVCVNAYVVCAYSQLLPVQLSGLNPYDIREKCPPGLPLCYNFTLQTSYLNSPEVKKALGVTKSWTTCNRIVDMVMVYAGDWMLNFQQDVATVLDKGYKVLVYAGEMDFICNWWGNYQWTQAFEWSGHSEYASASNHTWQSGGKDAGITKSAKGLTFLKVFKAGHMVPKDQPEAALDMLSTWLRGDEL